MSVDAQKGKAKTVTVVPPSPWGSPTATFSLPDGTAIAPAPGATPSAVDTTVVSATDPSTFVAASATGIRRGLTVQVTDPQWGTANAVVASVVGTTVNLMGALPGTPGAGATVVGVDISVALTSTHTATLGISYVLEVVAGDESIVETVNVVAHPFVGPMTEMAVRDYVTRNYPGEARVHSAQWYADVADTVNRRIRGRLLDDHVYVSQYWDPDALDEIGELMLQRELAKRSFRLSDEELKRINFELRDRIAGLLKSATPIDKNKDGVLVEDDLEGYDTTEIVR